MVTQIICKLHISSLFWGCPSTTMVQLFTFDLDNYFENMDPQRLCTCNLLLDAIFALLSKQFNQSMPDSRQSVTIVIGQVAIYLHIVGGERRACDLSQVNILKVHHPIVHVCSGWEKGVFQLYISDQIHGSFL